MLSWSKACNNLQWVGDGYCDDITNNPICNYDGGDCCLSNIQTTYCNECQCLEEGNNTTNTISTIPSNLSYQLSKITHL